MSTFSGAGAPPDDFREAMHLSGQGRFDEAAAVYEKILAQDPRSVEAHMGLSLMLTTLGRLPEAIRACQGALALRPELPELHNNLGSLFNCLNQHAQAEAALRQAVALRPLYVEAHYGLGMTLAAMGRLEEAEVAFQLVIVLRPEMVEAHRQLAAVLSRRDLPQQAEIVYRRALALQPGHAESLKRLGAVLHRLRRLEQAVDAYRQALAAQPGMADVLHNLGTALGQLGRLSEAEAALRDSLALRPDYADTQFGLGMILLAAGRLAEGWPFYEARHRTKKRLQHSLHPGLGPQCPQWQGEPLAGKSLLVWHEQGFGDVIQFGRYLALLKAQGASRITLACFPELRGLCSGLPGIDTVDVYSAPGLMSKHDYQTFIMAAPRWLKTSLETIPPAVYLQADAHRVQAWRERLAPLPGRKIGLAWRGSVTNLNDSSRSLSSLAVLEPLWRVPGLSFVSLQKGPGEDQALSPPAGQPLLHLGSDIRDFADTAAIIEQLDLVISVDTAVAHLAGSLGKPCWVMLPALNVDWRWMHEREDSPWYPGTMRLFRQAEPGNWDGVVAAMLEAIPGVFDA